MHLTLFIKSVLLLTLLNGATVSSAQAASLVYKSSCMSHSGEDLRPQPGMLIQEHAGGALFISRNSINVPLSLPGGASSCNSLIAALANGQFRVGRHVQGIGLAGTANSYINQRRALSLPAAAWLFSSVLFGFIVFANRRKV
ncbi:hypothetical protein [Pseudomonas batumici]|uniref:hypothetical protein n=1 Tax=Pseudomonas batumici TaxID=226910 RepID=UPI0012ED5362|nr:hypothetical protein [Pseudomonas batumici]